MMVRSKILKKPNDSLRADGENEMKFSSSCQTIAEGGFRNFIKD
jgi:hypothetical protein